MLEPDIEHAAKFVEALTGDPYTPITWQVFDDRGNGGAEVIHGPLDVVAPRLVAANKRGCGVYHTVNATDGKGRRKHNIVALRALFVDCDEGALPSTFIPFDVVVTTKRGQHGYWMLEGGERLDDWEPAQRIINYSLNTDQSICDLGRVMRTPGFYHQKTEATMVTFEEKHTGFGTIAEIVESLGVDASEIARGKLPPKTFSEYAQKLLTEGLGEGERNIELARIAGKYIKQGLAGDSLLLCMICLNRQCCTPPLDDQEVINITRSIEARENSKWVQQQKNLSALKHQKR